MQREITITINYPNKNLLSCSFTVFNASLQSLIQSFNFHHCPLPFLQCLYHVIRHVIHHLCDVCCMTHYTCKFIGTQSKHLMFEPPVAPYRLVLVSSCDTVAYTVELLACAYSCNLFRLSA